MKRSPALSWVVDVLTMCLESEGYDEEDVRRLREARESVLDVTIGPRSPWWKRWFR